MPVSLSPKRVKRQAQWGELAPENAEPHTSIKEANAGAHHGGKVAKVKGRGFHAHLATVFLMTALFL